MLVPLGSVIRNNGQQPDGEDSVKTEQRPDQYCTCYDEPSHHASPTFRLLPVFLLFTPACAQSLPEPETLCSVVSAQSTGVGQKESRSFPSDAANC